MLNIFTLLKVLSLFAALYFILKMFSPKIMDLLMELFFGNTRRKNSELDFDRMVEERKAMLRGDFSAVQSDPIILKKERKNKTDEILHNEFTQLTQLKIRNKKDNDRLDELKVIMSYADSLQWGSSKDFKKMAQKVSKELSSRVEETLVSHCFSILYKREIFLNRNSEVFSLQQIQDIIETFVITHQVLMDKETIKKLSKRWNVDENSVLKAIRLYFNESNSSIKKLLYESSISLPKVESSQIISKLRDTRKGLIHKKVFLETLKEKTEIFYTLSPLPNLKGNDDKVGALRNLGLPPSASVEQIKKQYKKLARLKHPDRLKAKGIPQEFEKVATENFTKIKLAYDILMTKV